MNRPPMHRFITIACLAALAPSRAHAQERAQDRAAKVRNDRKHVEALGSWIYDDLPRGVAEAKKSGKPLLVVFRCIPCEACAQLDEQVVEREPKVQALMERFVCVRIPHMNGVDLAQFQFDWDQSWSAFFVNADMTIYGRYGTRSHRTDSADDVSLEGFAQALEGALALHAGYPANKAALAGKRGAPLEARVPEEFPSVKGRFTAQLDWEGKVVQSCMHCHQVGEAQRLAYRSAGKPIPRALLDPYPKPDVLGLVMDARERARVKNVVAGSSAAQDGWKSGDEIQALEGQPILSIADVQWVLHHAGERGALRADVRRDGKELALELTLGPGWRREDISWRATSWDLRRMVTGGLVLEDLAAPERVKAGLDEQALALRVARVGQLGLHAAAKKAGFEQGDVIVAVEGVRGRHTESDLLVELASRTKPGERLAVTVLRGGEVTVLRGGKVTVLRGGKKVELVLPMQ